MKTVYFSLLYHGNMNYDRYPKRVIRKYFPEIYEIVIDAMKKYHPLKLNLQISGMSIESLKMCAPYVLEDFRMLAREGRLIFTGTYYSEPVNVTTDGETDFRCAWLGTEIVRRNLGEPYGFFPQEQSYHPQIPWIVKSLGLTWVTVPGNPKIVNPFVIVGLDGTKIYGIPTFGMNHNNLEYYFDISDDNGLIVGAGDLEIPHNFDLLMSKIEELNNNGKKLEIVTIPEYLEKFQPEKEIFLPPCAWQKENVLENPSFSRWISDPQDIIVHKATMKAMSDTESATVFNTIWNLHNNSNCDIEVENAKTVVPLDPIMADIESAEEFTNIEEEYLARGGKVTALSKSWHLVLWGVNSDATGWYPLIEKRRERILSFNKASLFSREVINTILGEISSYLTVPDDYTRGLIMYNPHREHKETVEIEGTIPLQAFDCKGKGILTVNLMEDGKICSIFDVTLPSYGYTTIFFREKEKVDEANWEIGDSIENSNITLARRDKRVVLKTAWRDYELSLQPFMIKEVLNGTLISRSPIKGGDILSWIRMVPYPQLKIAMRLDWNIMFVETFSILDDVVLCNMEFEFLRPTLIGEGDWNPNGLIFGVQSKNKGTIYYDIPFGVVAHQNPKESFIPALRFATLQDEESGVAIISKSGNHSFKVSGDNGFIGIGLGASTLGGPARPALLDVDRAKSSVLHYNNWEYEYFNGKYQSEFFIYPYRGDWQDRDIPHISRQKTESDYLVDISKRTGVSNIDPQKSFIEIQPDKGVEISTLELQGDKLFVRLYETSGRGTDFILSVGGKVLKGEISPFGIFEGWI